MSLDDSVRVGQDTAVGWVILGNAARYEILLYIVLVRVAVV